MTQYTCCSNNACPNKPGECIMWLDYEYQKVVDAGTVRDGQTQRPRMKLKLPVQPVFQTNYYGSTVNKVLLEMAETDYRRNWCRKCMLPADSCKHSTPCLMCGEVGHMAYECDCWKLDSEEKWCRVCLKIGHLHHECTSEVI